MTTDKSFLCLGECMVEMAPRTDGGYSLGFAGDTFNMAWYLRRLLPDSFGVAYGTVIGEDSISDRMAAFMSDARIDTSYIRRVPDATVGLYLIDLKDGERSFSYWRGQAAAKRLADDTDWLARVIARADVIMFSGITMAILAPEARDRLCLALAEARRAGKEVVFDTNMRPRLWDSEAKMKAGIEQAARAASTVLPSFDEEKVGFGDRDPEATLDRYRALGAERIVVKNGAKSVTCWSVAGGIEELEPVQGVTVIDSTAAGDSFGAGLMGGLALGHDLGQAVRMAMAQAALVVQGKGALVDIDTDAVRRASD